MDTRVHRINSWVVDWQFDQGVATTNIRGLAIVFDSLSVDDSLRRVFDIVSLFPVTATLTLASRECSLFANGRMVGRYYLYSIRQCLGAGFVRGCHLQRIAGCHPADYETLSIGMVSQVMDRQEPR